MKKRGNRGHVHAWQMTSPHPFGARTRYKCTSCPVVLWRDRNGNEVTK
jgi:hypothetical protein